MRKKSIVATVAFGMLLLLASAAAMAVEIVGEVEVGVSASQEVYIAFETATASMSSIEYGVDGEFTHATDTYVALDSYHIHTLSDVKPGTTYTYRIRISDWTGGEVVTEPDTLTTPQLTSPEAVQAYGGDAAASLSWDAGFGAVSYAVKRSEQSGGPYETIATVNTTSFRDQGLVNETTYYYVIAAVDADGNEASPSAEVSATPKPFALTESIDIDTHTPGKTEIIGDTVRITAAGNDIWGSSDSFRFVYTQVSGDVTITARVASFQSNPQDTGWGKAVVMIRETLNNNSKHAMTVASSGNGSHFQRRPETGIEMNDPISQTIGPNFGFPMWIRLKREGDVFYSYASQNGESWTLIGAVSIPMNQDVYVGLGVTAHMKTGGSDHLAVVEFDNIEITQ